MSCKYNNKEKLKNVQVFFLFNQGSVFWPAKSKYDVYFFRSEPETLDNPENRHFRIIETLRIKFTKKSTSAVQLAY